MMMVGAMNRVVLDVLQCVVHPTHVPFVREAEAMIRDRLGDARPCRRFLGNDDGIGAALPDHGIEMTQEADRLEIFAAAMDVRHPFTGIAAVVAIEHRGHGVDAQAVDVEMLEPMERACDQEALHLATAEIIDVGVPVLVEPFARIEMLVERAAVEAGKPVRIRREMRRHPVDQQADAGGMQGIDEAREILGRTIAAAGREQAKRLIPPGAAEGELGDRQQFDMGEAHLDDIGNELLDRVFPGRKPGTAGRRMHP